MIKSAKRPWMIRLSYSMPLINGIIFLILGFLPHLFYISGNNNPPTLSPFGLLDIVHANGLEYLSATASGTTEDFYFYMIMLAFWAVCTFFKCDDVAHFINRIFAIIFNIVYNFRTHSLFIA